MSLQVGDVVCYPDHCGPGTDVWVWVRDVHPSGIRGRFLRDISFGGTPGYMHLTARLSYNSQYPRRVVPPEEWPADVCAQLAKYQLLGEDA